MAPTLEAAYGVEADYAGAGARAKTGHCFAEVWECAYGAYILCSVCVVCTYIYSVVCIYGVSECVCSL